MHPLLALGTGTRWVPARRGVDFGLTADEAVAQVREHHPDVVFLCSPNNPTGTALDPAVIAAVLDVAPGMVVVDEAYAEFARPGTVSALAVLPGHPRLVVTRTMSKAFGFAGGRLGYLAADPAVVAAVQLVRLPYHLSALTQAAARAALAHREALLGTVAAIMATARPDRHRAAPPWPAGRRQRRQLRAVRGRRRPVRSPGGRCSTRGCWSATSACPAGCGSPPAPRPRPTPS